MFKKILASIFIVIAICSGAYAGYNLSKVVDEDGTLFLVAVNKTVKNSNHIYGEHVMIPDAEGDGLETIQAEAQNSKAYAVIYRMAYTFDFKKNQLLGYSIVDKNFHVIYNVKLNNFNTKYLLNITEDKNDRNYKIAMKVRDSVNE